MQLFVKKTVWLPRWRLLLLITLFLGFAGYFGATRLGTFLALEDPVGGELLVAEGWLDDANHRRIAERFRSGNYRYICTTGGPIRTGLHLSKAGTWAELAASTLRNEGIGEEQILVAAAPRARRDRTRASALALKKLLAERGIKVSAMDVCSEDVHTRRSRDIFQEVFGDTVKVGAIPMLDAEFHPETWWQSSEGMKETGLEFSAWLLEIFQ